MHLSTSISMPHQWSVIGCSWARLRECPASTYSQAMAAAGSSMSRLTARDHVICLLPWSPAADYAAGGRFCRPRRRNVLPRRPAGNSLAWRGWPRGSGHREPLCRAARAVTEPGSSACLASGAVAGFAVDAGVLAHLLHIQHVAVALLAGLMARVLDGFCREFSQRIAAVMPILSKALGNEVCPHQQKDHQHNGRCHCQPDNMFGVFECSQAHPMQAAPWLSGGLMSQREICHLRKIVGDAKHRDM